MNLYHEACNIPILYSLELRLISAHMKTLALLGYCQLLSYEVISHQIGTVNLRYPNHCSRELSLNVLDGCESIVVVVIASRLLIHVAGD